MNKANHKQKPRLSGILFAAAGGMLAVSGAFNSRIRALVSAGALGTAICALFAAFLPQERVSEGRAKRRRARTSL